MWLWLKVRRLRQYLMVAALTGLGGSWIGSVVSPVPGQLFADVAGIPLVYLSPVLIAVSLAQGVPVGAYWFETAPRPLASASVIATGLLLAFLPPLLTSSATEVCLISARNGLLLAALVLCVRRVTTASAACAVALVPCFVVWTFGWSESGEPKSWAFLLAGSGSRWVAVVTICLVSVGLAGLTHAAEPSGADP